MKFIGEIAALFTSFCWSLSAVGFSMAGKQFSSQVLNRVRVTLAFIALLVINAVLYGTPLPLSAGTSRWVWLMLSGIVGLAIGDVFLFRCYQLIGPRIGLLLLSLAPVFGALLAAVFFGEKLSIMQLSGIGLTLAGIAWVVIARPTLRNGVMQGTQEKLSKKGIVYGIIAAAGQAGGLTLSKQGMTGAFPPFAGTIIRMTAAIIFLWLTAILQREVKETTSSVRKYPIALGWTAFGALFGPVIGVSASLLAVQHSEVGVASTLMALPPVFMLPISYFFFKERFGWQSVAGTFMAMAGVALFFIK